MQLSLSVNTVGYAGGWSTRVTVLFGLVCSAGTSAHEGSWGFGLERIQETKRTEYDWSWDYSKNSDFDQLRLVVHAGRRYHFFPLRTWKQNPEAA